MAFFKSIEPGEFRDEIFKIRDEHWRKLLSSKYKKDIKLGFEEFSFNLLRALNMKSFDFNEETYLARSKHFYNFISEVAKETKIAFNLDRIYEESIKYAERKPNLSKELQNELEKHRQRMIDLKKETDFEEEFFVI